MIARVSNTAAFLNNAAANAEALHILHFCGYFQSLDRHAFGLVYEFPQQASNDSPITLHGIIQATKQKQYSPPSLGERFALAESLASTLLDLHKASLLHKSISSSNIAFLGKEQGLRQWYLTGFNHSRPNDPKAFTEGPPASRDAQMYHHPEYTTEGTRHGNRFRLEFDYYSLGLVLLEIALWDTITLVKASSRQELREKILVRRVPLLAHCVGTSYQYAVAACLKGDFGGTAHGGPTDKSLLLEFERVVVEALRGLRA